MEIPIGRLQAGRAFRSTKAVVVRRFEPGASSGSAAGTEKEAGRGAAYAALAGAILILAGETLGIAHGLAQIFGR